MTYRWTDTQVDELKRLYAKGLSFALIAEELGVHSRNAVIGKVHRLGLPLRGGTQTEGLLRRDGGWRRPRPPRPKPKSTMQVAGRLSLVADVWAKFAGTGPSPLPKADNPDDFPNLVALDDLEGHHCRWPIGDPKPGRFGFCGCPKVTGLPYCEDHARRAYQPVKPREKAEPVRVRLPGPVTALRARNIREVVE
jgi:GcrA cell cycle regulator